MPQNNVNVISRTDPKFEEKLLLHIEHNLEFLKNYISTREIEKITNSLFKRIKTLPKEEFSKDNALFNYKARLDDFIKVFAQDGLTHEILIKACIKDPNFINRSPETVNDNVNNFVAAFKEEKLNRKTFLFSCLKRQPSVLGHDSEALIRNFNSFRDLFEKEGLDRKTYLSMCIRHPALLEQGHQTLVRHMHYMMTMVDMDLLGKNKKNAEFPYLALINKIAVTPHLLSLGDENYIMRMDYAVRKDLKSNTFILLKEKKKVLETQYQENFNVAFSLDTARPELKELLVSRKLWPEQKPA